MTQERIMFSNPTPSEPRLSPAATMSNTSSSCRFSVLDHLCSNLSESFHPIPLPCALAFPPPSHRDTTTLSPCWAPHFMHLESSKQNYYIISLRAIIKAIFTSLESHPEQAAPLSRRDDRCHNIVSHSTLALRLHLAACSPSSSCRF